MSGLSNQEFRLQQFNAEVYDIVKQIPAGRVLTYGLIARLAGFPHYSRWVGKALARYSGPSDLPCHRVVNSQGKTAPHWPEQSIMLLAEGVIFKPNACVDLKRCLWDLPF